MDEPTRLSEMIRRTSHFVGDVQGVGFRYTAQSLARNYKVTGYVRNLPDGRVELVAEGEQQEIEGLLQAITENMQSHIKNRIDNDAPATGEFARFEVRR